MKDYIDLTQLPAEKVEAMVLALSKNDFDLLRKYCDELGILYGYPMEEVVNIFSDQLLLSKKTLTRAVGQMDPESLASRVGNIEETLPSKADLSALNPIQQRVADISEENSEINDRLGKIENDISELDTRVSDEIDTINGKITTINTAHDNLAGSVGNVRSDLNTAIDKLNTIQEGAEKNTINAIQLNGDSIQPINKTVNLTNVVLSDDLNRKLGHVSAALSTEFDTKLNLLNGVMTGANGALEKAVTEISTTLSSKLDVTVAENISSVLSSNIKDLSSKVEKTTTVFESQFTLTNAAVDSNKVRIDNLAAADTTISNTLSAKIDSVSSELMGFIKGKVDDLDDELSDKVSVGKYELKVENLDKKDNELADELSVHESYIDALKSEIDRHSHKLEDTITEIFVTSTNSTLRPKNGVISIDVATTSIINAQISAMADVFHVTVDELVEHFNEDLNVISAALDAKTDISTFNIVSTNVDSLKAVVSDHTQKIDTLKKDLNDLSIHTDELHQNSIALINELSTKHIKEIENEANIRREADSQLKTFIISESSNLHNALDDEKGDRIKTDDELKNAIKDLNDKHDSEIKELTGNVTSLKEKDVELENKIEAEIYERKTAITDLSTSLSTDYSSKLNSFNERIIKCEAIVDQNRELYKTHDEQITGLLTTTATNTANIESLTTRLKDHTEAGSKRFDKINGKLDELDVAINGDKSGGNGLADRIDTAEKEIAVLTADLNDTTEKIDSKLEELSDSLKNPESGLFFQVNGNSKEIAEVHDVVDNLLSEVFGGDATTNGLRDKIKDNAESISNLTTTVDGISDSLTDVTNQINGNNGITDKIETLSSDLSVVSDTVTTISTKLGELTDSITTTGGLSSQVSSNTEAITTVQTDVTGIFERLDKIENADINTANTLNSIQADITGIQTNTNNLSGKVETIIGDITNDGGINDKIGDIQADITGIQTNTNNLSGKVETIIGDITNDGGINDKIGDLSTIICGDGTIDNVGLSGVVDNLITVIGGCSIGSTKSISERLDDISNDLNGNHAVNPDIFGVHDRIEDLEDSVKTISGLSTDVSALQLSATAVVEKITSVSKDLDETRGWVNDLSETTKQVYEAVYGDGNPLNGLDNIVGKLSEKINDHTKRIEELEKNTVDFSPIYDRLDEVDESLSALSAENDSVAFAVETAINSIEALNDQVNALEKNKVDLSPINGRLDSLETENSQLLEAVTGAQNSIEMLDDNFEVRVSDIFVEAINTLASDKDYELVVDKDEYAAAIKLIDLDGSATINDVVKRLNAIIKIINDVAK